MPSAESAAILTVPNALTVLRVALIVPFAALAAQGKDVAALGVFIAAGVTDVLDGALARHWGQSSKWGRLADPLADKLLTGAAYVTLALLRSGLSMIPVWVMAVVLIRDLAILAGSLAIYTARRNSGFKPSALGKLNTLIELAVVGWFLAAGEIPQLEPLLPVWYALLLLSLVASLGGYVRTGLRMLRA